MAVYAVRVRDDARTNDVKRLRFKGFMVDPRITLTARVTKEICRSALGCVVGRERSHGTPSSRLNIASV